MVINKSKNATIQKGTAILVRNIRGIPITVIPKSPKRAITPKQRLWHTCQEPGMLVAPDTLPVAPINFSFMFLIIL